MRYSQTISGEVVDNLYHKDGKSSEPHTFSEQVETTKFLKRGHLDYQSNVPLLIFSIDVGYHDGYFRMDEDEGLKHMKWKEALELVS